MGEKARKVVEAAKSAAKTAGEIAVETVTRRPLPVEGTVGFDQNVDVNNLPQPAPVDQPKS